MTTSVTPYLWFDDQAEVAVTYYCSLLSDSRIEGVQRTGGEGSPAFIVNFTLTGRSFIALNGGPRVTFNEAVSLMVNTEDQAETDRLWSALLADGGKEKMCGWLEDRWGLSWQIVPSRLPQLLGDPDPQRAKRAMEAMLQMKKIDIAALERAAEG